MIYVKYIGMSYEQASREAAELISQASKGGWISLKLPEKLIQLRDIMTREKQQA